jgi:SAM-dependent methyltransferase
MLNALIKPSDDFNYYTESTYWNNYSIINEKFNLLISNNTNRTWHDSILKDYGTFKHALFLNCGNGWVERDLYTKGVISNVTAFDFSQISIDLALKEAKLIGMPCNYFVADCNKISITNKYNVVINHAAMHHVAFINRLSHLIALSLLDDGLYISFDYIGPHRNQYPYEMWSQIILVNNSLPKKYQMDLVYPHIKTMLYSDPTEAIHSEIQLDIFNRYFDMQKFIPLGGGVAYQLLFNNINLYRDRFTAEGSYVLEMILRADELFSSKNPHLNLFGFWIGKTKVTNFPCIEQVQLWQVEEDIREAQALKSGGRYYDPTALEVIYENFDCKLRGLQGH